LEQYRETRDLLRSELGLDPSPRLRELEQAILRQDPSLQLAPPPPRRAPPEQKSGARSQRRRAWLAIPGVAAAIATIVLGLLLTRESRAHRLTHPVPLGKHLLASVSSPLPSCCAFGFGGVWVVGHHDETVQKIDPVKKKVVASYRIAGFLAEAPLV